MSKVACPADEKLGRAASAVAGLGESALVIGVRVSA